jgi:hypothetical protein
VSIFAPKNLATFKSDYGYPTEETAATYFNEGDLGFGREMHSKTITTLFGPGVACYAKNFGNQTVRAAFPADPLTGTRH